MTEPAKTTLRARYTSPSTTKVFASPIAAPLPSSDSPAAVKDKVAYLSQLRASTKQLQEDINMFLTQKMEEDKAAAATAGQDAVGGTDGAEKGETGSKDASDEEYYAEEMMGDEEG